MDRRGFKGHQRHYHMRVYVCVRVCLQFYFSFLNDHNTKSLVFKMPLHTLGTGAWSKVSLSGLPAKPRLIMRLNIMPVYPLILQTDLCLRIEIKHVAAIWKPTYHIK